MNIGIYIVLLGYAVSMRAWEFNDIVPAHLFQHHESTVSHEFIKVVEPISCTITQQHGAVKVKGWNKEAISLKCIQEGTIESLENTQIMIDKHKLPHELACSVTKKNKEKPCAQVTLEAHVPVNCHLVIHSHKGNIMTKNLARTQSLHTDNGTIKVVLQKFSIESSLFVHNKRGNITVELPKKIQAQLSASTLRGVVSSDVFVTVQPQTTLLNKDYWHHIKKEVNGFLGDGGAPITLEAEYGNIELIAKK